MTRIPPPAPGIYPGVPEDEYRAWDAHNFSCLKNCSISMERFYEVWKNGDGEDSDARIEGRVLHAYLLEPATAPQRYVASPAEYPKVVKVEGADCTVVATDKTGMVFRVAQGRGKAREEWLASLESHDEQWSIVGDVPAGLVTVEMNPWTGSANFCRAWVEAREKDGGMVVKHETLAMCRGMAARLREVPGVQDLFADAAFEVSVVWVDPQTGLTCKARLDCLNGGQIADAKTSFGPVNHDNFGWIVKKNYYNAQAAMYLDGLKAALKATGKAIDGTPSFTFLAVEKVRPYTPAPWELLDDRQSGSFEWLDHGRTLWHSWLQRVAYSIKHNWWPGHFVNEDQRFPEREELLVPPGMTLLPEEAKL